MNIIQKAIFEETKKNQKNINTIKIIISILLLFIFIGLYTKFHDFGLGVKIYFLIGYVLLLSGIRYYFFGRKYTYYKYVNTFVDIIGILLLIQLSIGIGEGHLYSLYFMPLLLAIIVISSLGFEKYYTVTFGIFSCGIMIYLLYYDDLLSKYGVLVFFLFFIIYLASVYNVFHLNKIVDKVSHLKQLEKFTDSDLLEQLEKNPEILNQKGIQKELVIFFLDIRGFSKLSEKFDAPEIFSMLNMYLGNFSKIIEENHGVVDKYIGDCVMGYFEGKNQFENSYQTSQEIIQKLNEINAHHQHQIGIGIGMHYGKVLSGGLGHENRMDFTIIGDNVNITSRLESLTRSINANIIVSKDYYDQLKAENGLVYAGKHALKGKDNMIEVYTQ